MIWGCRVEAGEEKEEVEGTRVYGSSDFAPRYQIALGK